MNITEPPLFAEDLQLPGTREAGVLAEAQSLIDAAIAATGDVYMARMNQTSTTAPVATVVRNTFGSTPTWARTAQGVYTMTLASAFPLAKTLVLIGASGVTTDDLAIFDLIRVEHSNSSVIRLTTRQWQAGTLTLEDNMLFETEIFVTVVP